MVLPANNAQRRLRRALQFSARRRLVEGHTFGLCLSFALEPSLHFGDDFGAAFLAALGTAFFAALFDMLFNHRLNPSIGDHVVKRHDDCSYVRDQQQGDGDAYPDGRKFRS